MQYGEPQYPKIGIFKDNETTLGNNLMGSISSFEEYYECKDCKNIWKEFNKEFSYECTKCGSENITYLSEDEYVKKSGDEKSKELIIPLTHLKSYSQYKN